MHRTGHPHAGFFSGVEVEHTPAHGMKTLFVIGYHVQDRIDKMLYQTNLHDQPEPIKHIFFGANDSYRPCTPDEHTAWKT